MKILIICWIFWEPCIKRIWHTYNIYVCVRTCVCVCVCIIGRPDLSFILPKKEKNSKSHYVWWQSLRICMYVCMYVATLCGILTLLRSMSKLLMNSLTRMWSHGTIFYLYGGLFALRMCQKRVLKSCSAGTNWHSSININRALGVASWKELRLNQKKLSMRIRPSFLFRSCWSTHHLMRK